jgi:transposase InsO family protein
MTRITSSTDGEVVVANHSSMGDVSATSDWRSRKEKLYEEEDNVNSSENYSKSRRTVTISESLTDRSTTPPTATPITPCVTSSIESPVRVSEDEADSLTLICGMNIREEQLKDTTLTYIIDLIEQGAAAPETALLKSTSGWEFLIPQWKSLIISNGMLKKRYPESTIGGPRELVVLPTTMQQLFVDACHIEGGHQGREKTGELVQRRVYFPRWRKLIAEVCTSCALCAAYCRGKVPRQGAMQLMEIDQPMDRVAIDLTGPHPTSKRSNRFILTMVDCFSRYLIAVPIRNKFATTVAKAVNRYLFAKWGLCRELLTDQGTEFDNRMLKSLCKQYGVQKIRTSGYRPSANGRIERLHRSLNALLAKTINENHDDWDEVLDAVTAQYNGTTHQSTGFTPNKLMFGREILTSLDLLFPCERGKSSEQANCASQTGNVSAMSRSHPRGGKDAPTAATVCMYVDTMHQHLADVYGSAKKRSMRAALKRKVVYDRKVKIQKFEIGQKVLLLIEPCKMGLYNKWRLNYEGPFVVQKQLNAVNYVITRLNGSKSRVAHVDRLRPCLKTMVRQRMRKEVRNRPALIKRTGNETDTADFVNNPLRRSLRVEERGSKRHPKYCDYE